MPSIIRTGTYKSRVFFLSPTRPRDFPSNVKYDGHFEETQQKGRNMENEGKRDWILGAKLCRPHLPGNSVREFYPTYGKWRRGLKRLLNDFCRSYTGAFETGKIVSNVYLTL
jgi:hypothetical protein